MVVWLVEEGIHKIPEVGVNRKNLKIHQSAPQRLPKVTPRLPDFPEDLCLTLHMASISSGWGVVGFQYLMVRPRVYVREST